jgi:hypothetical protein
LAFRRAPLIVHRFGSLDVKQEQRYYFGIGPRKFHFKRPNVNWTESNELKSFWELMQRPWESFTYTVTNVDGTTTGVLVTFEQSPISSIYRWRRNHKLLSATDSDTVAASPVLGDLVAANGTPASRLAARPPLHTSSCARPGPAPCPRSPCAL